MPPPGYVPGAAQIFEITKRGTIIDTDLGFTTITGLAVDAHHRLYVKEFSTAGGPPAAGAGKLVLAKDDGDIEPILARLTFPVGNMAFGPDGALYLSNYSAFSARTGHTGEILRVEASSDPD